MIDIPSRVRDAQLLAVQGKREDAIVAYEGILTDIEAGHSYFDEGHVRREFARLLRAKTDPRELQQLTKAVAAFQRQNDLTGVTEACLRLAELNRDSETTARYWVDRAVAAAERGNDVRELCRALAFRAVVLRTSNHAHDAVATLEKVVQLPGGDVYADQLASAQIDAGRLQEGTATLTRLLAEAQSASSADAATRVVSLSIQLADGRLAVGDRAGALALLEGAQPLAAQLSDGLSHAVLMDRVGSAYLAGGDAAGAVSALERGVESLRRAERPDDTQLASLYINLGNALAQSGIDAGAIRAFSEAVRLTRGVKLASEARAHFGLANSASRLGAAAQARDAYEEARGLAVRLGDRQLEAGCLDSLGQLLVQAGDPARAVDLHRRAATLHREIADARGEHADLMNLAQAFLRLNENAAARRTVEDARLLGQTRSLQLPWQHALNEARVLARDGQWPQAREQFDDALAQLESQRASLQSPLEQRVWATRRVEAFEIATEAAFQARNALAAFSYLESNRARFFEAVSERRRRLPSTLRADVRKAYVAAADCLADVRWRRRLRPEAADAALELEYDRAERAYLELSAQVERARADEAAAAEPPPPIEQLAQSLNVGEVAVALHPTSEFLGVACCGRERDGSIWWDCDVEPRLTLDFLSRAVVGHAESENEDENENESERQHASWQDLATLPVEAAKKLVGETIEWLGELLWPVIERVLAGRGDALVLMPGRGLNVLPLHAVATADGRLAMDRWAVRYAPSLRLFARAGRPGALPVERVLGQVVDPREDLPFAPCESAAVRTTWKGRRAFPLLGPQAQPEHVLPLFEKTDVLHFSGHGAFDAQDPLLSRLLCAPGKDTDAITLRALLDYVPVVRTRVVLLSACETGRVDSADILNDQLAIPGGLLAAGASAVLATHWKVDDLAATLVLSRCVESWERDSIDLERALSEAQAWLREKATVDVVCAWIRGQLDTQEAPDPRLELIHDRLVRQSPSKLLFDHPLCWAAFHVTGRSVRVR